MLERKPSQSECRNQSTTGITVSNLKGRSTREQRAVNGIDDGLSADLTSTEKPAVKPLNGVFATLNAIELEVNVALGIGI